ncbi:hypothetical protein ASF33_05230 [Methylobacterium sp. Leaf92]|nr:hypothetical protein ASF33_05230 [Methylobacterium sp. Leaf92]
MTPSQAISALDRQLTRHGEDVKLRAQDGADDGSEDLTRRAFVREYRPEELSGGIEQGDREVILSPSGLTADPQRLGGLFVGDRYCTIEVANPVRLAGVVVRWNLQVRG